MTESLVHSVRLCDSPAPASVLRVAGGASGIVCDLPKGHDGPHRCDRAMISNGGRSMVRIGDMTWPNEDRP